MTELHPGGEFEDGTLSYFGLPDRWNTHGSTSHPAPEPGSPRSLLDKERVDLEPGERREEPRAAPGGSSSTVPEPEEHGLRRMRASGS